MSSSGQEKTACQYVVARFVPDEVRDEPINIGVILQSSSDKTSAFRFLSHFDRISMFLSGEKVSMLEAVVRGLKKELQGKALKKSFLESLSENYRHSLQFTEVRGVLSSDPKLEVDRLFNTFVSVEAPAGRIENHKK